MIFDIAKDKIVALKQRAEGRIIDSKDLYLINQQEKSFPFDLVVSNKNFMLTFSIENQPVIGKCYHISLKKSMRLSEDENIMLIKEVVEAFDFVVEDIITIQFENVTAHIFVEYKGF
jgi:hypothetical protein